MRTLISASVTVALLATPYTTADAATGTDTRSTDGARDTPRCVTKKEYRRTPKGTRLGKAHRIYDTKGMSVDGGAGGFIRSYPFCKGARKQAKAKRFDVSYNALGKRPKVSIKYCGPSYQKRRRCF